MLLCNKHLFPRYNVCERDFCNDQLYHFPMSLQFHRLVELANVLGDIFQSFIYDKEMEQIKIVLFNYLFRSLKPEIFLNFNHAKKVYILFKSCC